MMPYLSCKKIENDVYNFPTWQYCKYKDIFDSRIIINSTAKFYISISYQKDLLSIDTRIFTPLISLEMLAQMFYVSPYYLCREFKKNTNSTIIRYINVTRIMNAQRKFMETSKNITDISKETGFSNLTHFNRVFKSVTGMSPSQYRKQFRDNVKS